MDMYIHVSNDACYDNRLWQDAHAKEILHKVEHPILAPYYHSNQRKTLNLQLIESVNYDWYRYDMKPFVPIQGVAFFAYVFYFSLLSRVWHVTRMQKMQHPKLEERFSTAHYWAGCDM